MRAGLRISRVTEDAARVALITIALLAVMAAPGQAWQPSDNAYMHKYEQAAIGLWGSAPDCPSVEYIWLEADPWGEHGVRGRAADCRMWLMDWDRLKGDRWARREGFAWNCFLVLHEWGHLLGHDHDVIEPRHPEIERHCARAAERHITPTQTAPSRVGVCRCGRGWSATGRVPCAMTMRFSTWSASRSGPAVRMACPVRWEREHGHTLINGADSCRIRRGRLSCVTVSAAPSTYEREYLA
jgi:hypothetical protein